MAETVHLKLNRLYMLPLPLGLLDDNLYRDAEEYSENLFQLALSRWIADEEAKLMSLSREAKDE